MPPLILTWMNDKEFIEMLKYYEETNAFGKDYSKDNPVWQEISGKANLTAVYCRKKWLAIKYNYIKLKHMIRIGRVTEDRVRKNPRTARYMDGRLDFLEQFLSEIPDRALPKSVHSFFASLFGEGTDKPTHSVDAVKLIKLKKNGNIIQVIQDYDQETGTEPTCILPNIEQSIEEEYLNDDDSNDIELVAPTPVDQGILPTIQLHQDGPIGDMTNFQYVTSSSIQPTTSDPIGDMVNFQYVTSSSIQSITNDPIGDMATFQYNTSCSIQPTTSEPIGDMANFQYITTSSIQPTTNDPIGDMANFQYVTNGSIQPTKNEEPNLKRKSGKQAKIAPKLKRKPNRLTQNEELNKSGNCNLARFLVKYTNTNIESEQAGDLKEYMDDLAEVLCNRLAPPKRKYFLSQIDLIVSEMLEG